MVDLVVHSMGGMISRYYIDRVMQDRDVAQLIMLGSPMGGSDCSVLPAALGFYLPASIEIRESYMRGVFNQQITHRKGIEFYDLGGTAINDAFKSPCTEVPNDTVVSFESINAILLQSSREDVIHSELTLSDIAFGQFVKPLLQKPAGSFVSRAGPGSRDAGRVSSGLYARLHRPRRPGWLHGVDHQYRAGCDRRLVRTVRCLPVCGYDRARRQRQHHRAQPGERTGLSVSRIHPPCYISGMDSRIRSPVPGRSRFRQAMPHLQVARTLPSRSISLAAQNSRQDQARSFRS